MTGKLQACCCGPDFVGVPASSTSETVCFRSFFEESLKASRERRDRTELSCIDPEDDLWKNLDRSLYSHVASENEEKNSPQLDCLMGTIFFSYMNYRAIVC